MDLSMILSPAEEETVAPRETKSWSSDELQCAVAILQDFQPPTTHSAGVSDPKAPEQQTETVRRLDDDVPAATGKENAQQNGVWGDDSMSKLDLLVQADAVIKRRRPKARDSDSAQYQRSGVWSRAEEEYAAALVSYFLHGRLDLPEGTTLRKFLAEQLCCNRRRVSMKLATESLAGQKIPRKAGATVFVAAQPPPSDEVREEVERVLETLRAASFSLGLKRGSFHIQDESHLHSKTFDLDEDDDDDTFHHDRKKRSTRHGLQLKHGKPTIIRTGFESPEEEEFVSAMFEFFMTGVLDLSDGTKLVNYVCQQLGCTPKQLSMKLAPRHMGELKFPDNVGSITYMRACSPASSNDDDFSEEIFEVESRLTELRLAYEEAHKNAPPPVMAPMKRERKFSTASSSSSTGSASVISTPSTSPVRTFRRSGPWSRDEEVYAAALIDCFFKGILDIAEGTTLRAFLSSRLCCNPMRISKKLASECIAEIRIPKKLGSSTYANRAGVTLEEQIETEEALKSLRDTYIHSSTRKRNSKRSRSARSESFRSRATIASLDVDSDGTESDSNAHSVAPSRSQGRLEKLLKTEKTHSPEQARRQELQGLQATKVIPPTALKEQLA